MNEHIYLVKAVGERTTAEIVPDLRGTQVTVREAVARLIELDAEVIKLRNEVGNMMRREKKSRRSFATWTHRLTRRIQKLKANIADEESYIEILRAEIAALSRANEAPA